MRRSLFPEDDALPTWLHTLALFVVVSPFGAPLVWIGVKAIVWRHLEPVSGPEFGQYLFGPAALDGHDAVWAGLSLSGFGLSFFALAIRFMRAARERRTLRVLPWVLIAASIALGLPVGHHR